VTHQGDVSGVMEELVNGAQNGRGTQGSAMDAGIDVADHVKNGGAEQQPGSPHRGRAITKHASQDCQHLTLHKFVSLVSSEAFPELVGFKVYYPGLCCLKLPARLVGLQETRNAYRWT